MPVNLAKPPAETSDLVRFLAKLTASLTPSVVSTRRWTLAQPVGEGKAWFETEHVAFVPIFAQL